MLFTLKADIGDNDLERINKTNSSVIVAKPDASGKPGVAWLAFKPLQKNAIQWTEEYAIYASNTIITNGAKIVQLSTTALGIAAGRQYEFKPSGVFANSGETNNSPGAFVVKNNYDNLTEDSQKGFMIMGLSQNAIVNSTHYLNHVISAAPVLYKSTAEITPFSKVFIWTQSNVRSNTVITTVHSEMVEVEFGGDTSTISLTYDSQSGRFTA